MSAPGNPYWRGRISTIDFLVLTSLDQLLLILNWFIIFYKTTYLTEEVNRAEPSTSVSVPCLHYKCVVAWALALASLINYAHSVTLQIVASLRYLRTSLMIII